MLFNEGCSYLFTVFPCVVIQSFPRVVSLDTNGRQLVQWPVKELESLRRKQRQLHDIVLKTGGIVEVEGLRVSEASLCKYLLLVDITHILFGYVFSDYIPNYSRQMLK